MIAAPPLSSRAVASMLKVRSASPSATFFRSSTGAPLIGCRSFCLLRQPLNPSRAAMNGPPVAPTRSAAGGHKGFPLRLRLVLLHLTRAAPARSRLRLLLEHVRASGCNLPRPALALQH